MIELLNGLVLIADERCYIVGKPRQKPDKGIAIDQPTYHTSVAQAAQSALDRTMRQHVKDGSITTLRQFIEEQAKLQFELQRLIAPLDSGQVRQSTAEGHNSAAEGNYIP